MLQKNEMIELISLSDLSKAIKISESTLKYYAKHGKLPYYRIGKHLRFKANEVEEWLHSVSVKPYDRGVYDPKMEKSPFTTRHNG